MARLSLDDVPARERRDLYVEVVGRQWAGLDIEPLSGEPLFAELATRTLPELEIASGAMSPNTCRRTPGLLADGRDQITLVLPAAGCWRVTSNGREFEANIDQSYFLSLADTHSAISPAPMRVMTLRMPRAALSHRVANLDDATARPIPTELPALQTLKSYLPLLQGAPASHDPRLLETMSGHVLDLVTLVLGATGDGQATARMGGVAAARLQAIKKDIILDARNAGLSVSGLAARHRMTPRHLQRLLESDGWTFSAFLNEERLKQSRLMLLDLRQKDRKVATIAFDCGFSDISNFNRAFRRRYGQTPSEVREGARMLSRSLSDPNSPPPPFVP